MYTPPTKLIPIDGETQFSRERRGIELAPGQIASLASNYFDCPSFIPLHKRRGESVSGYFFSARFI